MRARLPGLVALGALACASTAGGAAAGALVTGARIADGTVASADIEDGALSATDIVRGGVRGIDVADGRLRLADLTPTARSALRGARGASGIADHLVQTTTVTVAPNDDAAAKAQCIGDTSLISVAGFLDLTADPVNTRVRTDTQEGFAFAFNALDREQDLTVQVVCASIGR